MKTIQQDLPAYMPRSPALRRQLQAQAAAEAREKTQSKPFTKPTYSGQELAPYTGRPGALDHLLLPSRVSSTLHYRNLSSIQTVRSERMSA